LSLICGLYCAQGCKSSTPEQKNSTQDPSTADETTATTTTTPTDTTTTTTTTCPTTTTTGTTLGVTQVTYDVDVKTILDTSCATSGCHITGATLPDLTTYAGAQASASSIVSDVNNGVMPMTGQLVSADIAKLNQWLTDGALQDPTTGTSTSNCGGTTTTDTTGVTTADTTTADTSTTDDPWQDLLNPPALEQCHQQGKIYDRAKQTCSLANIATSYQCTHAGIVDRFKKLNVNAETQLSQFEQQGYQIDQCGEYNNEPVVFMVKKVDDTDVLKLQIKRLCRTTTTICT